MTNPPWIGLLTFYGCSLALLFSTHSPAIQIFSVGLLLLTTLLSIQKVKEDGKTRKKP